MEPDSPLASSKGPTMEHPSGPAAGEQLTPLELARLVATSELGEAVAAERTAADPGYSAKVRDHLTARAALLRQRAARRVADPPGPET